MMPFRNTHRRMRVIGKLLLSALLVCCLTDVACSEGKSGSSYDVTLRRLEAIPPGTVIGKEAPRGWSNLIIKSYSRPAEGDVNQLSPAADRLTRLLFTAILADVKAEKAGGDKHYKLARVAVGLGLTIRGKDTVITPETQARLGANLGFLARVVLRTAQDKLGEITVLARSKTLLIFDSPSYMLIEARHKPIVLRYALLVEEQTGRLNTLVWALERGADGKYSGPLGAIEWLPPNLTDDCLLHVDGQEFSLGQPTEKAFAITMPPKGQKEIKLSEELKPLLSRPRFSATAAAELEGKLREQLRRANDD